MRRAVLVAVLFLGVVGCDDKPKEDEAAPPVPPNDEAALLQRREPPPPPPPPPAPGSLVTLPRSQDFGTVMAGDKSEETVISVQNVGGTPVVIGAVRPEGSDNIVVKHDCPPRLDAGGLCRLNVSLRGGRAGIVEGRIFIENDGAGGRLMVGIGGLVQARTEPPPPAAPPPPKPYEPSDDELAIEALNAARLSGSVGPDRPAPPVRMASGVTVEEKSQDPDWVAKGIEKKLISYPVNRCRVVTEDQNINALLEDTVHSELGGRVVAIVERNIYGKNCRFVLIPKGSSVIGYYQPVKDASTERLEVAWQRIITPQGQSVMFEGLGADAAGKPGLTGEIDRRLVDKYGTALMISGLSALLAYATPANNSQLAAAQADFAANAAEITAKDVAGAANIMPVITVSKRSRILIVPTQDLWFPEPKGAKK